MFRFQSAYLESHGRVIRGSIRRSVFIHAACLRCRRDQCALGGGKGAVFAAVKGVFEPVLQRAVLPEVSVVFIRRIELNITGIQVARKRVQAFIRQQKQCVRFAGVGLGIENAPFDGAVAPCAIIDVAVAASRSVIAVDAACARLYGFCAALGKGHGRQKAQRHT